MIIPLSMHGFWTHVPLFYTLTIYLLVFWRSPKDKVIGPAVYTKGAALVFLNIPYASAPDGKKLNSSHWFSDVKPLNDDTASSVLLMLYGSWDYPIGSWILFSIVCF